MRIQNVNEKYGIYNAHEIIITGCVNVQHNNMCKLKTTR